MVNGTVNDASALTGAAARDGLDRVGTARVGACGVWATVTVTGAIRNGIISARQWVWWWCRWPWTAEEGSGAPGSERRRVGSLGGACGYSGSPLVVLKTQVDGFFRYGANGMGGETQKCSLGLCLGVFQILESRCRFGCLGLISGIFRAVRSYG